jgi:hypothetical protein
MKKEVLVLFVFMFIFSVAFVNAEPVFGDDTSDTLIWFDDFESYADTAEMTLAGDGPWDRGGRSTTELDTSIGMNSSKSMKLTKNAGYNGGLAVRGDLTSPEHFFIEYWFRVVTGVDPDGTGKWIIVDHNVNRDGCAGTPVARYQFPWTTNAGVFDVSTPNSRFLSRGEYDISCDGPVAGGSQTGYFTWGSNPQMPPPVVAEDPDIGLVPWSPINDGNWHKHTIEIKTGDGTNSYTRLWLDGNKYWDSFGSPMNLPGIPTYLKYELTSGHVSDPYEAWFDNVRTWKRTGTPSTFCPDGVCNGTETYSSCPADCPEPPTNTTYFGDLNHDGRITISDIMIIMRHILNRETNWDSDVDEDGEVNIFDLVKVARIWGKQYETDTTAPTVVSSMPSQSILPLGTSTAIVGVETDERAVCRYNPTPTNFASMIVLIEQEEYNTLEKQQDCRMIKTICIMFNVKMKQEI